ncbi:hypothetical protein O3P69_011139 [Scylla paramamosain]|uniref:Uncharacterized protein n=1 Tax=Scylla paramamosain TaxID=85552 RepID=A0AAW0SUF4_SCYPA
MACQLSAFSCSCEPGSCGSWFTHYPGYPSPWLVFTWIILGWCLPTTRIILGWCLPTTRNVTEKNEKREEKRRKEEEKEKMNEMKSIITEEEEAEEEAALYFSRNYKVLL